MKNLLDLLVHLLTTVAKRLGPGGARAVVADNPLKVCDDVLVAAIHLSGEYQHLELKRQSVH
jgi:hypothetical protein